MEQIRENKMGTAKMLPLIVSMSLPSMFSMLIQALYNVVDSIFVAQYDLAALSAVSLVFPVPVSYTHLDVYKRQVTYPWNWRAIGFKDPDGNNIDFVAYVDEAT